MGSELSTIESETLQECEAVIERGLATFVEVGTALLKIRDSRLYRIDFDSFEEYCQERWDMSRPRAYQLIDAANIARNVSTMVDTVPTSERQARPLASLDPDEQRQAWNRALDTAPNGRVTAEHVKATVDEMFPRREPLNGQGMLFEEPIRQPWSDSEYDRKEIVENGGTVTANIKTDLQLIAWAEENGLYVRIDRQSAWGNPFILDEDGDRDDVCDHYRVYLQYKPSLQRRYDDLRGKVLGCWCYPERCHGNVLISILDGQCSEDEPQRVGCHR